MEFVAQVLQQWLTVEGEVAEEQIVGSTLHHPGEGLVDPHNRKNQDMMMEEEKGISF